MKEVIKYAIFAGLPIAVELWYDLKNRRDKKIKLARCAWVCILVNFIVLLARMRYGLKITTYEYLLLDCVFSFFIVMGVLPVIEKKRIDLDTVMHMVCLIAITFALYSCLSVGQANIHSDMAAATLLVRSQIKHHSFFPTSWCYVNGDVWVIGLNLFVMPFYLLLENQSLVRALGSALLIIVTLIGLYYNSRKLFNDHSWVISMPLLVLFLYGIGDMILYSAAYTGQMFWLAMISVVAFRAFSNSKSKGGAACFAILLVLLCMGGIRQVAECVIPVWCAFIIMLYIENREAACFGECKDALRKVIYISAVVGIPSVVGLYIYKYICNLGIVVHTESDSMLFVGSLNDCCDNFIAYILNMFSNFGFNGRQVLVSIIGIRNMVSVCACLLVVFIIPVLQFRKLKGESEGYVFFYIFGIVHNLIMFLLAILFGKTAGRYMLSSIFICMMVSAHYVIQYWYKPKNLQKIVCSTAFITAVFVQCIALLYQSRGWQVLLEDKREFAQILIDHNLTKGYASFWNAYTNMIYSDLKLEMGGVLVREESITPFRWLVDADIFEAEDTSTFLLLSEEEKELISSNINDWFGSSVEEFVLDNMYVYVYDYDIVSNIH